MISNILPPEKRDELNKALGLSKKDARGSKKKFVEIVPNLPWIDVNDIKEMKKRH
jgi:hypothetical protein